MDLTPEEREKLKQRILGPKETEYQSAAGKRRVENHDIDKSLQVYQALNASSGPSYIRAAFNKGYRK